MIKVKLQKKPSGSGEGKYITYVITLPKVLIETGKFKSAKEVSIELDKDGNFVLKPAK